jgi:hypothetical protein
MNIKTKVLASIVAVGGLGSFAAFGVYGGFTTTTSNTGNEISAGTVTLGDNDMGSAMYFVTNASPGDSVAKCIKVTYLGTLGADVDLYSPADPVGPLAQYVDLTITQGVQASSTFPDCTGFTPAPDGVLFSGTLQDFSTNHSHANAIHTDPRPVRGWVTGDSLVYKITATVNAAAPITAQGTTTSDHGFVWTATDL